MANIFELIKITKDFKSLLTNLLHRGLLKNLAGRGLGSLDLVP